MIPTLPPTPENLQRAASALRRGELVAMPTETVYGLAGDALNPAALARIFEVKQRPFFDPLIVHIADSTWVEKLCAHVPASARLLMEKFWPGPLTLALPKTPRVPDLATSGLPTVALRMPSHPVALELIRAAGTPLAAPSANPFGLLSPTRPEHVAGAFEGGIDCILDGGPCSVGLESTVLGFDADENPVLFRPGGISSGEIESALETKLGAPRKSETPQSPGDLPSHYAPRTPLFVFDPRKFPSPTSKGGLLWFGGTPAPQGFVKAENLSPAGNLHEAAANLFSALHRLDSMGLNGIYACAVPETGLGLAINDRLRRASTPPGTYAPGPTHRRG